MPISATGADPVVAGIARCPASGVAGDAGFTLVELMVVIVVVGLMSAAVVIALPDPRGSIRDDSSAFAARLAAAHDLSIIGGRDVAVRIDAAGYGFSARARSGWEPLADKALAPRRWGPGISVTTAIEGDAALVFDTTGLATPAQVILQRDGASARVSVDGGGAVRIDAR